MNDKLGNQLGYYHKSIFSRCYSEKKFIFSYLKKSITSGRQMEQPGLTT